MTRVSRCGWFVPHDPKIDLIRRMSEFIKRRETTGSRDWPRCWSCGAAAEYEENVEQDNGEFLPIQHKPDCEWRALLDEAERMIGGAT